MFCHRSCRCVRRLVYHYAILRRVTLLFTLLWQLLFLHLTHFQRSLPRIRQMVCYLKSTNKDAHQQWSPMKIQLANSLNQVTLLKHLFAFFLLLTWLYKLVNQQDNSLTGLSESVTSFSKLVNPLRQVT